MMRKVVLGVSLAIAVVLVMVVSFSQEVADWWTADRSGKDRAGLVESIRAPSHGLLGSGPFRDGLAVHVIMWSVVGVLAIALVASGRSRSRVPVVVAVMIGVGLAIEVLQEMFTLRDAEFSDLAGNLLGVSVAVLGSRFLPEA